MNVLVIGSGGREHALVWKIRQSPRVKTVFVLPGNAGTQYDGSDGFALVNRITDIRLDDIDRIIDFSKKKKVSLVVVGPEEPLVNGIADALLSAGIKCFGPESKAAQLEGSKIFTKEILKKAGAPTAASKEFSDLNEAKLFIEKNEPPFVVKADGLAAGKGVFICQDKDSALSALDKCMNKREFGDAGRRVLIEECLAGRELSFLAFVDGQTILPLAPAQDYKRALDGNSGPNTGGMGSFSPSQLDTSLSEQIIDTIVEPTIGALREDGVIYKGILYTGLMLTDSGPKVLEFNVRFGDPETQAILPRLKNDIVEVFLATINGSLDEVELSWDEKSCVCVAAASGGYPGPYSKGCRIGGLSSAAQNSLVFHAGTEVENGAVVTCGGRVLGVCSLGDTLADARNAAYESLSKISFKGMHFRKDIAV